MCFSHGPSFFFSFFFISMQVSGSLQVLSQAPTASLHSSSRHSSIIRTLAKISEKKEKGKNTFFFSCKKQFRCCIDGQLPLGAGGSASSTPSVLQGKKDIGGFCFFLLTGYEEGSLHYKTNTIFLCSSLTFTQRKPTNANPTSKIRFIVRHNLLMLDLNPCSTKTNNPKPTQEQMLIIHN